jgi:fructosamine-3-kinase
VYNDGLIISCYLYRYFGWNIILQVSCSKKNHTILWKHPQIQYVVSVLNLQNFTQVLVMELLPTGGNLGGTKCWASVGATLAKLHTATGQRYGWAVEEYAFGDLKFSNAW